MRWRASSARHDDMISRQTWAMPSALIGPGLRVLQAADHLRLALRTEHGRALLPLDLADFERQRGALVEQREQLGVDGVDLGAELRQGSGHGVGSQGGAVQAADRSNSRM